MNLFKGTFTNLNFDLITSRNKSIDIGMRQRLIGEYVKIAHRNQINTYFNNYSSFYEENKSMNLYEGISTFEVPYLYIDKNRDENQKFEKETCAPSGSLSTSFFGQKFNKTMFMNYLVTTYTIWNSVDGNTTIEIEFVVGILELYFNRYIFHKNM